MVFKEVSDKWVVVMKVRQCYNYPACRTDKLTWEMFVISQEKNGLASSIADIEHLKKLWESPYLEFYCCECYENMKFEKMMEKQRKREKEEKRKALEKKLIINGKRAFGYIDKWG